jgi:hypothetical protein
MIRRLSDMRPAPLELLRKKGILPRIPCDNPGCDNTVTKLGAICISCALDDAA